MMNDIIPWVIRNYQRGDEYELSALICENASRTLAPHYTPDQWEAFEKYYTADALSKRLGNQNVFCAMIEDQIVGTIALDGDFVIGFYTRVDLIGQGIGKQLMNHVEKFAWLNGCDLLFLAASPVALDFYYKTGWKKLRDIEIVHEGVRFDETLMVKELE